jgi:hypothetical protein
MDKNAKVAEPGIVLIDIIHINNAIMRLIARSENDSPLYDLKANVKWNLTLNLRFIKKHIGTYLQNRSDYKKEHGTKTKDGKDFEILPGSPNHEEFTKQMGIYLDERKTPLQPFRKIYMGATPEECDLPNDAPIDDCLIDVIIFERPPKAKPIDAKTKKDPPA